MKKKLFSILISLMFVFSAVFQSYLPIYSVHAEDENVEINEGNFPDDIFRNYILETIDTDKNGSLSVSEIEKAKSIRIDDESLTDLTGIEYFVFLESLDCSVTKVLNDDFTINVTHNTRLKELNVSGRKIGNIDVSHNLELESFACRGCGLSTLNVSKNTKLIGLDISNNRRISSLDVSHNNLLAHLSIPFTMIESINLENLKELERLDVYDTNIKGLDVSQSEKLEYLGFSPSMNIAWLNVGNNNDLRINWLTSPSNFIISGCGASFKIQDEFPGIDVSKVKIISGGNIDNNTGVVYGYKVGSSTIIYEYDCGIVNDSPKKHEVKLSVRSSTSNKGESTVIFKDKLDKVYDGKAVETPKNLTIVGSQAEPTYKWYQKDGEGWKELEEAPTQAGDYRIVVSVAGDTNYNGCEVSQEFKITKAESSATMNDKLDKVYDGKAVEVPKDLEIVGSEAEPTYKWYQKNGDGWKELEEAPSQAGDYRIVVSVAGDTNYNGCEVSQEFKITKAESSATIKDKLDKVYDGKAVETPKDLTIVGSQAEPTYKWYQKDGEGWKELEEAPTQAGDYRIVVSVAGDANYNGCEVSQEFKITKAIPTYEIPNLSDGYINGSLKDIILPDCWMWVNENQSFDKIGIQTFNAIYIPSDIINYEIIYNIPLKVNVLGKEESLSENKPSIDVDIAENIDHESENNVDKNDNTTHIVKTNDNTLVIGWIVGIIVSVSLMSIIIKHKKN